MPIAGGWYMPSVGGCWFQTFACFVSLLMGWRSIRDQQFAFGTEKEPGNGMIISNWQTCTYCILLHQLYSTCIYIHIYMIICVCIHVLYINLYSKCAHLESGWAHQPPPALRSSPCQMAWWSRWGLKELHRRLESAKLVKTVGYVTI